jgi:hypothetical protein
MTARELDDEGRWRSVSMSSWTKLGGALAFAVALSAGLVSAQGPQAGQPGAASGAGGPADGGPGGGGRAGNGPGDAGRGGGRGAAPAPVIPVDPHDLSGYWQLPPDFRDGRNVPEAVLAAGVTRQALAVIEAADKETVRYCNQIGMPAMMGLGTVYEIMVSPKLLVVMNEYGAAQNRWIYLNRSQHIPKDTYDPSLYGDSIGHWEGDTMVVETTMFSPDRGILAIPGGGYRTEDASLVERFKMLKNGQVLSVISTWTDPKVFKTPHVYEYRYNKVGGGYESHQPAPCDQYDDERVAFLSGPPKLEP